MALGENNIGQTGGSGQQSVGQGAAWRDTYLGGLDLSKMGASDSTATSTSGAVTVGDRILGGFKARRQFGLVKILAIFAGAALLYKIYKKKRG